MRPLREGEKLPVTPEQLIRSLPRKLKELFFDQWDIKQNPKWHPEGNTLKHIIVVIKRAYAHYPDDPNMILAALFHDLGKKDTYKINPKTGQPTAYGHEDVSTKYVDEFSDWIESFDGTNVEEIKFLVQNHMKVKPSTWDAMRDTKKEPIQKHPAFDKLMGFTDKLDGGGYDIKKQIKEAIKEVVNESEDLSHIDYIVDKYYFVDFETRANHIAVKLTMRLTPRPNKKVPDDMVFYSSYERKYTSDGDAIYKKYDENTAYNDASFFENMNLKNDLEKWMREKSNEFIRKNYDE